MQSRNGHLRLRDSWEPKLKAQLLITWLFRTELSVVEGVRQALKREPKERHYHAKFQFSTAVSEDFALPTLVLHAPKHR